VRHVLVQDDDELKDAIEKFFVLLYSLYNEVW